MRRSHNNSTMINIQKGECIFFFDYKYFNLISSFTLSRSYQVRDIYACYTRWSDYESKSMIRARAKHPSTSQKRSESKVHQSGKAQVKQTNERKRGSCLSIERTLTLYEKWKGESGAHETVRRRCKLASSQSEHERRGRLMLIITIDKIPRHVPSLISEYIDILCFICRFAWIFFYCKPS